MTEDTAVAISGSGFAPASLYRCVAYNMPSSSRTPCLQDSDCSTGTALCDTVVACLTLDEDGGVTADSDGSVNITTTAPKYCAKRMVSLATAPSDKFTVDCSLPATVWGGCFSALQVTLSLELVGDAENTTVPYSGSSALITYIERWTSFSPSSGTKFGGSLLTVLGKGFDEYATYTCKFTLSGVSLTSEATVISATTLQCTSPNWAALSGLGGGGGVSTVTVQNNAADVASNAASSTFEFVDP